MKEKKKKRHIWLVLVILLLLLALAGGGYYYYTERQKPQKAINAFMQTVQNLDFDTMASYIQTEDLSVLNGTDIRNEAYTDFFRSMCQKITYEIVKTHFDFTNGTANVTVRLNYIDGSEIYKKASTDFIRQIASASFAGTEMTDEEMNQALADTLVRVSAETEDHYLVAEVSYPMISIDGVWKVISLDEETIKIMSANFSTVESELEQSVSEAQNGKQVSMEKSISESDVIDLQTDRFSIHYTQYRISKDIAGKPCILVYYEYTNKDKNNSMPMIDISLQAFQNQTALEVAIPETTEEALDMYTSEIEPKKTVIVCQAFSLADQSDVTLKASEAFVFGGGNVTSQILKVQ